MDLCARVLAAVQHLRNTSFMGWDLVTHALCCHPAPHVASTCGQPLQPVHRLAQAALTPSASRSDPSESRSHPVTCCDGHDTPVGQFVVLYPGACDTQEALVLHLLDSVNETGVGAPSHICISLARALQQWGASQVRHQTCPRLWAVIRCPVKQHLVLRPMCEKPECMHAVSATGQLLQSRVGLVSNLFGVHERRECSTAVELHKIAARCGKALVALTQASTYGNSHEQNVPCDHVVVADNLEAAPRGRYVPVEVLVNLHGELGRPLSRVEAAGPPGSMSSHLWLCRHHAAQDDARAREKLAMDVVSMKVEWLWKDGYEWRRYGPACTLKLEGAYARRDSRVEVSFGGSDSHVVVISTPMVVQGSNAPVWRRVLQSCVCVSACAVGL